MVATKLVVQEAVETVTVASQSIYPMELNQTFPLGRQVIIVESTAKTVAMRPTIIAVLLMCVVIKTNTAIWRVAHHQLTRRATRISTSAFTILTTTRAAS